jgi:hypothetical protein
MMQFRIEESKDSEVPYSLHPCKESLIKKGSSAHQIVAGENEVYVLYLNKSFEILKADDIETVLV